MYQYANSFTYVINNDRTEIMLSFRQNYPKVNDKGEVEGAVSVSVGDILLSKEGLLALKQLLDEIPRD